MANLTVSNCLLHRFQIFESQSWGEPQWTSGSFLQSDSYIFTVPAFIWLLVYQSSLEED